MTFVRGTGVAATWVEHAIGVAESNEPTANIVLPICTSSSILWVASASVAACTAGAQAEGAADTTEVRSACVVVSGGVAADDMVTGARAEPTVSTSTAPRKMALERAPPRIMMSSRSDQTVPKRCTCRGDVHCRPERSSGQFQCRTANGENLLRKREGRRSSGSGPEFFVPRWASDAARHHCDHACWVSVSERVWPRRSGWPLMCVLGQEPWKSRWQPSKFGTTASVPRAGTICLALASSITGRADRDQVRVRLRRG